MTSIYQRIGEPPSAFKKHLLPTPANYYDRQEIALQGNGPWRAAVCPFHPDTCPSLRINFTSGAFRCTACGARGDDVLTFHRLLYRLSFVAAARELGAWEAE